MGMESFYVNIIADKEIGEYLKQIYNFNANYKTYFGYGLYESIDNKGLVCGIEAYVDNFIPANIMIYRFLSYAQSNGRKIKIEVCGRLHDFDFESKVDFISFIYASYESMFDHAFEILGAFTIPNNNYYRSKNKLHKYYHKILP